MPYSHLGFNFFFVCITAAYYYVNLPQSVATLEERGKWTHAFTRRQMKFTQAGGTRCYVLGMYC